jgi:poly-gamma-glutamate capsule biosynthesis protein CapA/YwtB (metallophosphatase superfamily)
MNISMKRSIKFSWALAFALFVTAANGQDTTRLSLLFLGDIMQHDSQIADAYNAKNGTYDYRECFQHIRPYIEGVDLAIGNLEVTLAGRPYKGYPQFSAPDELLVALKDLGLDVLVTANNHCVDRGKAGVDRTIAMLDSFNIPHTGTFRNQAEKNKLHPLIVERQGFRLAILNYTYGTNGLPVTRPNIVNLLDTAMMRKDLEKAVSMKPDVIIVFPHWGTEYLSLPSSTQKAITELCFRYGARLVIGAHPHVLQPMEWRKSKDQLVAYSLGNFVSGQRKRYTDGGAMIRIELGKVTFNDGSSVTAIDTAGYILEWVYRDPYQNYYVLPSPDVEEQPGAFVLDSEARTAFKTFVSDSRALFGKYNINVTEFNSAPDYYVDFDPTDSRGVVKYLEANTSMRKVSGSRHPTVRIGPYTLPDALHMMKRIRDELDVERAEIRKGADDL